MAYRSDARADPVAARKRLEEARARVAEAEERCRAAQEEHERVRAVATEQERILAREVTLAEMARGRAVRRRLANRIDAPGDDRGVQERREAQVRQALRSEAVIGALDQALAGGPAPGATAIPDLDLDDATHRLQTARKLRAVHAAETHARLAPLEESLAGAETALRDALAELEAAEAASGSSTA